jgi:hypothetical protein
MRKQRYLAAAAFWLARFFSLQPRKVTQSGLAMKIDE